MKHVMIAIGILLYVGLVAVVNGKDTGAPPAMVLKEKSHPGVRYGGDDLNESERAGAEIWFKATGGNERFLPMSIHRELGW